MPLVVICGYPSSGKSTWARKLAEYLEKEHQKTVHLVREEEHFRGEKNDILDDSRKEKELRAKVKSEAQRLLTKENVVIVDALNYIKGYRYELYCMSKAVPTRQVTVHCDVSETQAWEWNTGRPENEKYKREVFDHLVQRFEAPDPQNRWDSPFFSVLSGEELDLAGIYNSLVFSKAPKKNMSTQSNPLSETNYLSTMEKVTSEIIQAIVTAEKNNSSVLDSDEEARQIEVPYSKGTVHVFQTPTVGQLNKLKRQFISLSKTSSLKGEPGDMFVQYLNSQLISSS